MKKCIVCGQEFEPKNPKGIFCSPVCRQRDYRGRVRGWLSMAKLAKGDFSRYAKSDPNATYARINWNPSREVEEVIKQIPEKQFKAEYMQDPEPVVRTNEDIWAEIRAIMAEKVPEARNTPNGKRYWQFEQDKRIKELKAKLK